jgi:Xaa-Pro aminopeptidase
LVGLLAARLAGLGVTAPAREGVVCATEGRGPVRLRQIPDSRPIASGALVVLDPSTLYAGYEGGVGRTWVAGDDRPTPASQTLASRCRAALDGVLDACRAGGTGADLRRAWEAAGEQMPPVPLAHGVGLGVEPPIIASGVGDRWDLVAGMVLSVQGWVAQEGVGGVLQRELVLVGDGAPRLLSRFGGGPLLD